MTNKFSIKTIAKALDVRPQRLRDKLATLQLHVEDQEGELSIRQEELLLLAKHLLNSKRITPEKRFKIEQLMKLTNGGFIQLDTFKTPISNGTKAIRKAKKVYKKSRRSKRRRLYKVVPIILGVMVQSLESLYFKFIALFVAIGVQMHHSAVWFYKSSPDGTASWASAIGFAIMYDLFILVVTMEGRTKLAKAFAVLTFGTNLLYFEPWVNYHGTVQCTTTLISAIIISVVIAFIIYAYTEIFVTYKKQIEIKSD